MTGLPGKSWRLASAPSRMTRSPLASSCSVMRRPCSTVSERKRWYSGQTPRTARLAAFHWLTSETVAAQLRADGLDQVGALLDRDGVVDGEADIAACGVASGLRAGLAAEEDGDVRAHDSACVLSGRC